MKRVVDFLASLLILILTLPLLLITALMIWLGDRHSPFYVAPRVGKDCKVFQMIKFRSMTVGADRTGVDSTAGSDIRITRIGKLIRKTKIDELPQLLNVLRGEMSIVGPRPNVMREVQAYTFEERQLLRVRPGITDLASIVFSDEGDLLDGSPDPDLLYNQIIRPWKSRLGLLYIHNQRSSIDFKIIFLTIVNAFFRRLALLGVNKVLVSLSAGSELVEVSKRVFAPPAEAPPGATEVVTSRVV